MLAAEVVASASGMRREPFAVRTTLDVMSKLPAKITQPVRKGGNGLARCICADEDYLGVYRGKYPTV